MSTVTIGHEAEVLACDYLEAKGFAIIAQNWRTRSCEIDIVARKDVTIYFVEVKFRHNSAHGYGYEYITNKKVQQMAFAARQWVHAHNWRGGYELVAISVDKLSVTVFEVLA